MFNFMLSLVVLSVMFSVIAGFAFLIRQTLLVGREGLMYPFWVIILLISILPIRFDMPSITAKAPLSPDRLTQENVMEDGGREGTVIDVNETTVTDNTDSVTLNNFSQSTPTAHRLSQEISRYASVIVKHSGTITTVLFIVWITGASISFARLAVSYFSTSRIMRRHSSPCHDEYLLRLLDECRQRVGISKNIELRVFEYDALCSPCVCGIVRPTLYLEPGCAKLSERELSCVLIHELAHIKRRDLVVKLFCIAVTSLHWFNPTSYCVKRAMFEDCELACDYSVVQVFGNNISSLYMNTILDFVERFSENNRLVGQSGIGGGLFIIRQNGTAFLKRRFSNMKNYRKNRFVSALIGIFTLVCVIANMFVLSACQSFAASATSPEFELSAPIEQMLRAHYGLGADDAITPEMIDGITSLKVILNEQYEGHILVSFEVNGDDRYAHPLPSVALANYFESVILPPIKEYADIANATAVIDENTNFVIDQDGSIIVEKSYLYWNAFYCQKDPYDPELTEEGRLEMLSIFPELEFTGAQYYLDPHAYPRERARLYQILDNSELLNAWELDNYTFDCTSLASFTNLSEVEFIGLTPTGYSFPSSVNVTVTGVE